MYDYISESGSFLYMFTLVKGNLCLLGDKSVLILKTGNHQTLSKDTGTFWCYSC